jgi:hypothetical protein
MPVVDLDVPPFSQVLENAAHHLAGRSHPVGDILLVRVSRIADFPSGCEAGGNLDPP